MPLSVSREKDAPHACKDTMYKYTGRRAGLAKENVQKQCLKQEYEFWGGCLKYGHEKEIISLSDKS